MLTDFIWILKPTIITSIIISFFIMVIWLYRKYNALCFSFFSSKKQPLTERRAIGLDSLSAYAHYRYSRKHEHIFELELVNRSKNPISIQEICSSAHHGKVNYVDITFWQPAHDSNRSGSQRIHYAGKVTIDQICTPISLTLLPGEREKLRYLVKFKDSTFLSPKPHLFIHYRMNPYPDMHRADLEEAPVFFSQTESLILVQ